MKKYFTVLLVLILSVTSSVAQTVAQKITLEEVQNNVGRTVTVCGQIHGGISLPNARNTPTLLNMGGSFPNHQLTLVIFGENLKDFPAQPEVHFANQQVCVTGLIIDYKGKPEIILKSMDQIKPETEVQNSTASANFFIDTTNKNTGPIYNGTPNKPGITSNNASDGPVVTNKPPDNPAANTYKAPNTPATGSGTIARSGTIAKSGSTTNKLPVSTPVKASMDDIKLTQDVYMRLGPSFDYPLVSTVKSGTVVTVLSSSNGWSQVVIKDKDSPIKGYIKNSVLK